MGKIKIKYECPYCGKIYDTKEEAEVCQYPEREKTFPVGSIVVKGPFLNHPKETTWISDDGGLPGVSAKPTMDWYRATNRRPDSEPGGSFYPRSFFCRGGFRLVRSEEVEPLVQKLKDNLQAAEKFLARVRRSEELNLGRKEVL